MFRESAAAGAVLAHQGGWDEILMVLVPILVIVGVLRVVKRRVERNYAEATDTADQAADHS